jgi:GTPase SAR1 family protein
MKELNLALWGPSAAGKTALLAQLFLLSAAGEGWEIFPTEASLPFIEQMQTRLQTENLFPKANTVGAVDELLYHFVNRSGGTRASLHVEDRAGQESEEMNAEWQRRLNAADGLVLLFDPMRERVKLRDEVIRTLRRLYVASQRGADQDPRDRRPVAVCLSKADLLIRRPEDSLRARREPDAFVRERMVPELAGWINQYCANYRLFPVSAAGIRMRRGVVEPVVFYDEGLQLRIGQGGEPFNLLEPFLWIFSQLEGRS